MLVLTSYNINPTSNWEELGMYTNSWSRAQVHVPWDYTGEPAEPDHLHAQRGALSRGPVLPSVTSSVWEGDMKMGGLLAKPEPKSVTGWGSVVCHSNRRAESWAKGWPGIRRCGFSLDGSSTALSPLGYVAPPPPKEIDCSWKLSVLLQSKVFMPLFWKDNL